jgi:1-aminocyclopropane-1-carboxylate deaminase/D-cysteine desulfhydrase-like pyridoxal-dependent ACC family enzyme
MNTPTPVQQLTLDGLASELWLKQDGLTHARYGGNKARKAALLLADAARRGARRVLTIGAAGSHHVLATTLFGPDFGLGVAAVLTPQPSTAHAKAVLRLSISAGLEPYPSYSGVGAACSFLRAYRRGDYVIPPGGSNARGAHAYAIAVEELEQQVASGALPAPDWIVAPVGSGGTAAGLLAGLARSRLRARLLAVSVLDNPFTAAHIRFLARRTLRLFPGKGIDPGWERRLYVDRSQIGRGYGFATHAGEQATQRAAAHGLVLDPTYTAKAFAAALALARGEHASSSAPARILYWHTLSVPLRLPEPTSSLTPELERLFIVG